MPQKALIQLPPQDNDVPKIYEDQFLVRSSDQGIFSLIQSFDPGNKWF